MYILFVPDCEVTVTLIDETASGFDKLLIWLNETLAYADVGATEIFGNSRWVYGIFMLYSNLSGSNAGVNFAPWFFAPSTTNSFNVLMIETGRITVNVYVKLFSWLL